MTNTVVAYATAHGTTQSIAQRIAEIVGGKGDDVELRALDERSGLGDLAEVDCLIIGSAIHNGQWLPAAEAAVRAFQQPHDPLVVWAFSVSSVGATSSFLVWPVARALRHVTSEPRAVTELRTQADVGSHRFFAGAIAPGDWPRTGRILFRLMGGRYGDARDWDDVDEWAGRIISSLTGPR
ncbi:flavodoxin domain-containing protein [Williamsia muralis]|uniref:Flavodoxin domain-containing protein n=1 Tax=Williamsia marianensis TaxID=85044 RepID=A0ABU4EZA7_WILMA|nr:flavodoxin domain-containing protein [Williamsia muralis]MDV7136573.1 flavodoxin domain-containing protein [Williamsia muralis]